MNAVKTQMSLRNFVANLEVLEKDEGLGSDGRVSPELCRLRAETPVFLLVRPGPSKHRSS